MIDWWVICVLVLAVLLLYLAIKLTAEYAQRNIDALIAEDEQEGNYVEIPAK